MSPQPRLATLDYLAEVAKDWVVSSFATAVSSDFAPAPHRFEFDDPIVRRRQLPRSSPEAANPLGFAGDTLEPVVWARSDTVTLLADTTSGSVAYEQEIVEILGVHEDDVFAEAALVVRIPDFAPCVGRFFTAL
jgi:hypothetical protein